MVLLLLLQTTALVLSKPKRATYALAFHGEYQRNDMGHAWKNDKDKLIGTDFFITYPGIKENIIEPLEQWGGKVVTYFDTYTFADCPKHDAQLIEALKPARYNISMSKTFSPRIVDSYIRVLKLVLEDRAVIDYVIISRFDAVYHVPISNLSINWNLTNAAFRDDHGAWDGKHKISDLFFVVPMKHVQALIDAFDEGGDLDGAGAAHFSYDPFVKRAGNGSMVFIDNFYYGSSSLDEYMPRWLISVEGQTLTTSGLNGSFLHINRSVGPDISKC